MAPVTLSSMTPTQEEGWRTLLDLYQDFRIGWCLIGGQMVWLLAIEHGIEPIWLTDDVDVAVDIRADQEAIRRLCAWLESRQFRLEGINKDGIGHRFLSTTYPGPGQVKFDVLAPDNVGQRADLTTSPPARTVSAPGTRYALDTAQAIEIVLRERSGHVLRPSLIAALLAKAAATTIPVRENPDRDWRDAAFLLTLVADPIGTAAELTRGQKRRLRTIRPLLDQDHPAWRQLGERGRLGKIALEFLLEE